MSVRAIEVLQRYLRRLGDEAVPPEDAVLLKRFGPKANVSQGFEIGPWLNSGDGLAATVAIRP